VNEYSDYYWESSMGPYYEANGVGLESYREMMTFQMKKSMLFEYNYDRPDEETGKGGIQQVKDSELMKKFKADYIMVDSIDFALYDEEGQELSEKAIASVKKAAEDYAESINDGDKTFAQVVKAYTGSEPSPTVERAEGDPKTLSETASLYSADDEDTTNYELFSPLKKEKDFDYGKAYVVGGKEQGAYHLVVFYDLTKDDFRFEQQRSALLYALKDEEFDAQLATEGDALTLVEEKGMLKYYDPSKIDYDQVEA
jgi:hypothetical protein